MRIRWEFAKNPPIIRHKSAENPPRIRWESAENLLRIHRESGENPVKIHGESTKNPVRIRWESACFDNEKCIKWIWLDFDDWAEESLKKSRSSWRILGEGGGRKGERSRASFCQESIGNPGKFAKNPYGSNWILSKGIRQRTPRIPQESPENPVDPFSSFQILKNWIFSSNLLRFSPRSSRDAPRIFKGFS